MQTSLDLKMDSLIQNVRSRTADNFKAGLYSIRKCVNGIGILPLLVATTMF
uniref:Uncharacterized protein n=1 Tax=Brugia malayi TaxID=6279 RepID=Q8IHJ8_BRUMA|nr:hypothetical protein [Brugia malayi]